MGKHFYSTRHIQSYKPRAQAPADSRAVESKLYKIGCAAVGSFLLLAVAYLVQVNTFSTKGYEIHNLQVKIEKMQEQNKKVSLESSELQSLQRIQSAPETAAMVPVTNIAYIRTTSLSRR